MSSALLPRGVRAAATVLAAAGLVASLTACRPEATTSNGESVTASAGSSAPASPISSANSASPTSAATTTLVTTSSAAATSSAPGSVTVAISSPVSASGTVATPVSCATGRAYRADVASAVVQGNQLTFGVSIAGYRGPGSYPAIVSVTLHQSTGAVTTLAGVTQVPAVITASGGSFTVSATGSEGRTFSGSLTWVCGS